MILGGISRTSLVKKFRPFLVTIFMLVLAIQPVSAAPQIHIWYGNEQTFGANDIPQVWINILGNVTDPGNVQKLAYTINDGPEISLSMGPDGRRLTNPGDFNIDIPVHDLKTGKNIVVVTAVDQSGAASFETVVVHFDPYHITEESTTIDWHRNNNIDELAQVVDGQWEITPEGLHNTSLGYDRAVAIGNMWWQDYEVTVPVTIHRSEPVFEPPSNGASVLIVLRWQGHRIWDASQPAYGWWPLGAAGSAYWPNEDEILLSLNGNKVQLLDHGELNQQIEIGVPYIFKLKSETLPGKGSLYSMKVWKAGSTEPSRWQLTGFQRLWDPLFGSLFLVAHHTEVTFGEVVIQTFPRSPWEWFTLLEGYLVRAPIILACLVGLVLAIRSRISQPEAARFTIPGVILLLIAFLLSVPVNIQLPLLLHRQLLDTHQIGLILAASEAVVYSLGGLGILLLLLPWFRLKRNQTTTR